MALAGLVLGYIGVSIIPVLIIAAIAIPNLLRSKMAANAASAVGSLRTLNESVVVYSTKYGTYPPSLAALGPTSSPSSTTADLIDSALASGTKSGYVFNYHVFEVIASNGRRESPTYTITANPVTSGTTGTRYFFTDQSGTIRMESDRVASADSPPI
jgi:type II secretory pathway pseudopilin PulG